MDHVGMDLGKRESQVAILTEEGELIEMRIRTERHRLVQVFGRRPKAKILVEASTESEWVACCLEGLGHEVIVADPNYAPMYSHRTRRVKTDRRDARALAHACKLSAYRAAHRTSTQRRHLRTRVAVREALVRTRAAWITRIQPLLRREGWRIRSGAPETFIRRVEELALPPVLKTVIAPLLQLLAQVESPSARARELLRHEDTSSSLNRERRYGLTGTSTNLSPVLTRTRRSTGVERPVGTVPRQTALIPRGLC